MNEAKARGLLGLAVRARQIHFGEEACRKLVRSGGCALLMLDEAAGIHTRKKAETMSRAAQIPLILLPAGFMEQAMGRGNMMAAVQQGTFSEPLTEYLT